VQEFVDTHAAAAAAAAAHTQETAEAAASGGGGEGGAIGADVKGDWLPPLHTAYQDLFISVIEEVQEAFAVGGEAVMAAVGALAGREQYSLTALIQPEYSLNTA
jgi:DNA-binding SARP family transcriptional activator